MSRCKACDVILNDVELNRTDKMTGKYIDLCFDCAKVSNQTIYGIEGEEEEST